MLVWTVTNCKERVVAMFNSLTELMEAKNLKDKRSIPWSQMCQKESLSKNFIKENLDQVNWLLVTRHQVL